MSAGTRLWHPFADMSAVRSAELVLERGEDVWVWDTEGNRYLDATASLWYANVGHGRQEIVDAATAQMRRLEAYSAFGDFTTQVATDLAARLADLSPMDDARIFLGSGGGDAIDTAAKLARRYWQAVGEPQRVHLISRLHSYHGTHGYGTSLAGIEANRAGFGVFDPATSSVPHDDAGALAAALERIGPENVAAFFCEPVIGAGGVHPPPPGYLEACAALCDEAGVLFVADCVINAFGRLGTWYGVERFDLEPDMITFAKGVTSGYLPLGGVVVSGRVAEPFWDSSPAPMFRHGATYAAHATCCAAALANLDILEREELIPRGRELEGDLLAALEPLAAQDVVAEVRGGVGLLAAVALPPEVLARRADAPAVVAAGAREAGVLVRALGAGVAVSPPLTIQREHLAQIAEGIGRGVERLAGALAAV
jgi:adenosylmethionine-8-amino-7-oxononanoate aminotransferase